MLIALNKSYGVICQFSPHEKYPSLKTCVPLPNVYPVGRLDTDSEGLLLLTDEGRLQNRIATPKFKLTKTYWVQVEGYLHDTMLETLQTGVDLGDFVSDRATVRVLENTETSRLWPRNPPIRVRKTVPDFWLGITIHEGKNRQVRRMCAKVGLPCLRLVRVAIGALSLWDLALQPNEFKEIKSDLLGLTRF